MMIGDDVAHRRPSHLAAYPPTSALPLRVRVVFKTVYTVLFGKGQ